MNWVCFSAGNSFFFCVEVCQSHLLLTILFLRIVVKPWPKTAVAAWCGVSGLSLGIDWHLQKRDEIQKTERSFKVHDDNIFLGNERSQIFQGKRNVKHKELSQ